jgi:hypothetical protein
MNVAAALQAASVPTSRKAGNGIFAEMIAAWLAHHRRVFEAGGFRH